jgi:isocitrate dehydrogenase
MIFLALRFFGSSSLATVMALDPSLPQTLFPGIPTAVLTSNLEGIVIITNQFEDVYNCREAEIRRQDKIQIQVQGRDHSWINMIIKTDS